jgi:hypothetical protein
MPAIPVIPYDPDQEFEKHMESKKGLFGLKEMLNSKDQVGNTLFNALLQGAGEVPAASMNFLKNKFAPAVGNFMFGPTPDVPRDMQGTEMVPDPQNPGRFIHPGALQLQQRDSMF